MDNRIVVRLGVGDHPPERLARHEMDELWRIVKARRRYNTIAQIMEHALLVADAVVKNSNG